MFVLPKDEDCLQATPPLQVNQNLIVINSLVFTSQDITLYNEKDENYNPIQIYESDSKTKFMSFYGDDLSKKEERCWLRGIWSRQRTLSISTSHLAFTMTSKKIQNNDVT